MPGANPYAITRAYKNSAPAGIDPNAVQTILNANAAGFRSDVYIELCRGINATSQVLLVQSQVLAATTSAMFYPGIYLKVIPTTNTACSWSPYSAVDNCNYLKEAANAVWNIGKKAAIFSTANIWKQFFGTSCNTFATDTGAYLWYANYESNGVLNSVKSTADYVPFGGWQVSGNKVWVKQIAGKVGLMCGGGFVDIIWDPLAPFV